MPIVYVIDSSALIDCHRRYPSPTFDGVWDKMTNLIRSNQMIAPTEVFNEISKKDDWLTEWCKNNQSMFIPVNGEIATFVSEIMEEHPGLVKNDMVNPIADPFVIALARSINAGSIDSATPIVVAHEGRRSHTKIPAVCDVENKTLLEMFNEENWRF